MGLGKWIGYMEHYREQFFITRDFVFILAFITIIPTLKAMSFRWLFALVTLYMALDITVQSLKQSLKKSGIVVVESGIEIEPYHDIELKENGKIKS